MNDPQNETDLTFSRALTVHQRAVSNETDLLALAKQRALDPSVFDSYPAFFWSGEASSSRWDSYDTQMGGSSLQNYAADASAGVAFLRNHDSGTDPLGYSLAGRYIGAQGNGVARLEADFYALQDTATQPYLDKIRAGVVRDLSIGFYGGQWLCSICGRDMQEWFGPNACPHLLGMTYTPRDEAGTKSGDPQKARATIENAHLAEISGVYDGSTPGAMIGKARMLATEGHLSARRRELVEVRYHIRLPDPTRRFAGADVRSVGDQEKEQEDPRMTPPGDGAPETPATDDTQQTQTSDNTGTGVTEEPTQGERSTGAAPPGRDELTTLRSLLSTGGVDASDVVATVRALHEENTRLRPLADEGRQYRADLMADALAEGVRAVGAKGFAQETYKGLLESAPLAAIKRMRDDWKAQGDKLFAGGRQSVDDGAAQQQQTTGQQEMPVPPAAFRG